jgi:tetratricopeptide (TPR) repeat protein
MSWKEVIQEVNLAILNGKLEEAQAGLLAFKPADKVGKRVKAHFEALVCLHRGQFAEAKTRIEGAIKLYGENVNIFRDLLACQYFLQDMMGFRINLERFERMLLEFESQLSYQSLYECDLQIGKYFEEEGRLAPALHYFDRALKRADRPEHRLRALIQKSRWHALYHFVPELSGYYRELISVPRHKFTADLRIELEHTLMLLELRLVGSDHAWQRVTSLGSEIPVIDQKLLIFDFLEGSLSQDLEVHSAVLEKLNSFDSLDPFESFVRKVVQGSLEATTLIQELAVAAPHLSWANYLRLLCLSANLQISPTVRQELNRKIQLIIRGLDEQSQSLWTKRLKQALQAPEIRIDFSARSRSLSAHGKVIDLSKKKIALQLLEGLAARPTLTVDEAISLLWQSTFSPEHYHRLRMSVHRLNAMIHEITGLGKIIEVDSQQVRLRPEVNLRPTEDAFDLGFLGI